MIANKVHEKLMDTGILTQLGVEGSGEDVALTDENGEAVASGESLDLGACTSNARGADEDHLQRVSFDLRRGGEDGRVDLAAIGVALDRDI